MPDFMDGQEGEGDEYFIEVADVHVCVKNIQYSNFSRTDEKPTRLDEEDSLGIEKHISVDPFSLKESAAANFQPPASRKTDIFHLPPLRPPTKPKFLSYSLPNSASSSPKFGSMISTSIKRSKNPNQVSPLSVNPCFRQDSIALANLERLRQTHLRRSKSCGEGRTSAPPEELDLLMLRSSVKGHHLRQNKIDDCKAEDKMERHRFYTDETPTAEESYNEKVKCRAFCLFLPGFSKATKPVRSSRKELEPQDHQILHFKEPQSLGLVVSKRASLEKFECGSWRSSVLLDDSENQKDGSSSLFFDLPLEMIRCSSGDTHLPVTTAFVFDKDRKGVLKKSSSRTSTTPKKSPDSSRHVRFSTSSPTSYPASPTFCTAGDGDHDDDADDSLKKAREDLNSFLAVKYL